MSGVEQDCTQFAVLILFHDSTGCDEMCDYFALEADTMIDIVRLTWIKINFDYLYFIGIFIKLSHLNDSELLFSICMFICSSIKGIKKYLIKKRLYITSVTHVHGLVISNDYKY